MSHAIEAPDCEPEVIIAATLAQAVDHVQTSSIDADNERATGMASALEESGEKASRHFHAHHPLHESHGEVGHGTQELAHDVGATGHRSRASHGDGCQKPSSSKLVCPHGVPPVREHARPVQPMPSMSSTIPMASRSTGMGTLWKSALAVLITLTSALQFEHPFQQQGRYEGQEGLDGQACSQEETFQILNGIKPSSRGDGSMDSLGPVPKRIQAGDDGSPDDRLGGGVRLGNKPLNDLWELDAGKCIRHHLNPRMASFDPRGTQCPVPLHRNACQVHMQFDQQLVEVRNYNWTRGSRKMADRPWTGMTIFYFNDQKKNTLTNAVKRGLLQRLRAAVRLHEVEQVLMARSTPRVRNSKVDLLETFAGSANVTKLATQRGLKTMVPMDYNTGFDLADKQTQRQVDEMLTLRRPLLLLQEIDCRPWTLLQDNTNFVDRPEALEAWRNQVRPMLKKIVSWCEKQDDEGRFWLIENPQNSRLWKEPALQRLLSRPTSRWVTCHTGAYGATNSKGQMIKKPHTFAGNCPLILERLTLKLDQDQLKQCQPLAGKETTLSQEYCPGLVEAIVCGLCDTAQQQDPKYPNRFLDTEATFDPFAADQIEFEGGMQSWQPLFDRVVQLFKQTSHKTIMLARSDPLWDQVQEMVPWYAIERIQLASQPMMHRFPTHVPHTHRGSALVYNDGDFEVIIEDLEDIRFPKGRFKKPVNYGIFFFGYMNDPKQQPSAPSSLPPQLEPPQDNPIARIDHHLHDINFPFDKKYTQETKTVVARLHRNLGHPQPSELKKLLAMNGINNQDILAAVEDMKCGACERTRMPAKPPPAAIPDSGYRHSLPIQFSWTSSTFVTLLGATTQFSA